MRKLFVWLPVVALLATPAFADYFSPGIPNGWDNTTPMTDNTDGTWSYSWTGTTDNPTLFDILSESGNWDSKVHPSGNQWVTPGTSDGNTLTLDTNTYADGWYPDVNRVKVAEEAVTDWTAVGDWQSQVGGGDWDNGNVNTAMSDMGGGVYMFEATLAAGWYQYKAVSTGTWNAIGGNSRNVNADNFWFEVTEASPTAQMWVDVYNGTVKVEAVPEPGTLALLGLAGLALLRRR